MNKHVYTQEQLDKMSDLEKTIACAEKMGYEVILIDKDSINVNIPDFGEVHYYEPIENYDDCMPIAGKFGLSTYQLEDYPNTWFAGKALVTDCYNTLFPNHISEQPTIQRAIVYCFLMMEV